jgi:hypothetical protein
MEGETVLHLQRFEAIKDVCTDENGRHYPYFIGNKSDCEAAVFVPVAGIHSNTM